MLKNENYLKLKNYDDILEKNSNDVQFYTHILSGDSDESRKNAVRTRLDISKEKISHARDVLDDYVLKDM